MGGGSRFLKVINLMAQASFTWISTRWGEVANNLGYIQKENIRVTFSGNLFFPLIKFPCLSQKARINKWKGQQTFPAPFPAFLGNKA